MIPALGMSLEHTIIVAATMCPPFSEAIQLIIATPTIMTTVTYHATLPCPPIMTTPTYHATLPRPPIMTTATPTHQHNSNFFVTHNIQFTRGHFCIPQFQIRVSTLKTDLIPCTWANFQVCMRSKCILISAHSEVSWSSFITLWETLSQASVYLHWRKSLYVESG